MRFRALNHPVFERFRRFVLPAMRWAVAFALLAYIAMTLRSLGWSAIWQALPSRWTFYAIVALIFLVQPLADLTIYRRLWRIGPVMGPTVMLRKRFFNATILDYSGEAWLFAWARRHMPGREALILHTIKDSALLSASASLLVTILLIAGLLAAVPVNIILSSREIGIFIFLALSSAIPVLAYGIARKRMTSNSKSELVFVFTIHLIRSILNNGLAVLAWSQGLPGASLLSLLELLALRLVVSRVPFLGNKDLVFLGTGFGLAAAIDLPQAGVAAVLLAAMAVDQLLNLVCVGLPLLVEMLRAAAWRLAKQTRVKPR